MEPAGNELVEMVSVGGAAPITNCNVLVEVWAVGGVESVTMNVYVRLLVLLGMPLMMPVDEFSVNPVGSEGEPPASPQV